METNLLDGDTDSTLSSDEGEEVSVESPDGESSQEQPLESGDERTEREPEGESDEDYSKRVQKRIGKEVFLRKSAEEARKASEERERRLQAEIAALRADVESVKSRNATADAQAVEGALRGKLESARQRLQQAIEDGDTKAQALATEEIADIKADVREAERFKQQRPQAQESKPPVGATAKWLERNTWFHLAQNQRAANLAREMDMALQDEGFNPNDPEMYNELSRRLKAALPKMAGVIKELNDPPKTNKASVRDAGPPTGTSSAEGLNASQPKTTLTQKDLEEMENFGLNPNSKEHRKVWLRTHKA